MNTTPPSNAEQIEKIQQIMGKKSYWITGRGTYNERPTLKKIGAYFVKAHNCWRIDDVIEGSSTFEIMKRLVKCKLVEVKE